MEMSEREKEGELRIGMMWEVDLVRMLFCCWILECECCTCYYCMFRGLKRERENEKVRERVCVCSFPHIVERKEERQGIRSIPFLE